MERVVDDIGVSASSLVVLNESEDEERLAKLLSTRLKLKLKLM